MTKKLKIVYELTNSITKEKYVGVTSSSLEIRIKDHLQKSKKDKKTKIYKSIATYGAESFEVRQVDSTYSYEELARLEEEYIQKNRSMGISLNSDKGGGFKKPIYLYSTETLELVKTFNSLLEAGKSLGIKKATLAKICSNERRKVKGFYCSYRKYEKFVRQNDKRKKGVLQYNLSYSGKVLNTYESVAEASRITGITKSCIAKVCRGERNSAGGFSWSYQ